MTLSYSVALQRTRSLFLQEIFVICVACTRTSQVCCAEWFVGWDKARPQSHFANFRWLRLAGDVFTHNDAQELAIVPQTLAYHISWGIDPPSRRIHCAWTLGLLPTNYTHISTYDKQVCFAYLYV
jgi:hypothetical protein